MGSYASMPIVIPISQLYNNSLQTTILFLLDGWDKLSLKSCLSPVINNTFPTAF